MEQTPTSQPSAAAPVQHPPQTPATPAYEQRSFVVTWLLSWLAGTLGIDRFYLGYTGLGILKLITLGGCGIWALIDLILTLAGKQKDAKGQPLAGYDENKKIAWIVTGAVFALGLILNLVSSALGNVFYTLAPSQTSLDSINETDNRQPDANDDDENKEYAVGEQATLNEVVITVSRVQRDFNTGNQFSQPEQGKEFILVDVTIENKSDETVSFGSYDFKIQDSNGVQSSESYVLAQGGLGSGSLAPGGKAAGNLSFEVPAKDTNLKLIYNNMNVFDKPIIFAL